MLHVGRYKRLEPIRDGENETDQIDGFSGKVVHGETL